MKILFLLSLFSLSLLASIGNIAAMKGSALIKRESNTIPAVIGMEIEQKDEIITQTKARVQVVLKDQTVVTIGANSTFSFLEFSLQKGDEKVSMQAKRGFFRSVTGHIGKIAPQRFKVHTVSATIGIRGTDFSALIQKDIEIIKCYKGMIRVTYSGGYKDIPVGNMIQISPKGVTTKPLAIKITQKNITKKTQTQTNTQSQTIQESPSDTLYIDDITQIADTAPQTTPQAPTPAPPAPTPTPQTDPFVITPQTNDRPVLY